MTSNPYQAKLDAIPTRTHIPAYGGESITAETHMNMRRILGFAALRDAWDAGYAAAMRDYAQTVVQTTWRTE